MKTTLLLFFLGCSVSSYSQGFSKSFDFQNQFDWANQVEVIDDSSVLIVGNVIDSANSWFNFQSWVVNNQGEQRYSTDSLFGQLEFNARGTLISIYDSTFYSSGYFTRTDTPGAYGTILMLNHKGVVIKARIFDSLNLTIIYDVAMLDDGNLLCTGLKQNNPPQENNIFVLKTTPNLDLIWLKEYSNQGNDAGISISQINHNLFVIGASAGGFQGDPNPSKSPVLIFIDSVGNYLEHKNLGSIEDEGGLIVRHVDQLNIYGFGSVDTNIIPGSGVPYEDFLFKSDLEGNINWKFFINEIPEVDLFHLSNILLYKNRIYCVGTSLGSAGQIIAFDTSSNFLWSRKFYSQQQGPAYLLDLAIDSRSFVWVVGTVMDTSNPAIEGNNAWVMKLDTLGCIDSGCQFTQIESIEPSIFDLLLYPNPSSSGQFTLRTEPGLEGEIEVFDLSGREVYSARLSVEGRSSFTLAGAVGIYILKVETEAGTVMRLLKLTD